MEKEDFDYSDENATEADVNLSEDLVDSAENEQNHLKHLDETLVKRRRRLERMLEAKRLSKQLFDYEDEEKPMEIHVLYDEELFGDSPQEKDETR